MGTKQTKRDFKAFEQHRHRAAQLLSRGMPQTEVARRVRSVGKMSQCGHRRRPLAYPAPKISAVQPILPAMDMIAAHCDHVRPRTRRPYALRDQRIRVKFFGFFMAPFFQMISLLQTGGGSLCRFHGV